jgi:hypothetical protein
VTANSFRRGRLVEEVTHGPITAPRFVHHTLRVAAGFVLAWALVHGAGFPWWGAWTLGALLVIAGRFVAMEWCGWRPLGWRYVGPNAGGWRWSVQYLRDEHTACALALNVFGGFVFPSALHMPRDWTHLVGLLGAVAFLGRVYWTACPLSEP